MKTLSRLKFANLLFLLIVLPFSLLAGDWNTNKAGVVLDGFDVVSYREDDKAIKGSSKYAVKYDGVKFHFANRDHRDMFVENPRKYAPKYNGYCAFAMGAKGGKVPANADTFKMYNGELLVFFNDLYDGKKFNTKIPWNGDEKSLYANAEKNWKKAR